MTKSLIFSDIHITSHKRSTDRLQDCLKCLEWVFETASEQRVKNIIFVGDLFHDRQKIDVLTFQSTFEIFKKWEGGFDVFLLLGNHDMWHSAKRDVTSIYSFSALDKVRVIPEPCTFDMNGWTAGFLPYTHNPAEDMKNLRGDVLFGHVAIDGAIWNVVHGIKSDVFIEHDGDMIKVGVDIFQGWKRVFLGHYHAEQKLSDSVEYVGSPLQLSFGEAFQHKHVIIYDAATDERMYIRNTFSPQHLIVPEADLHKYELDKNFVRLVVEDVSATNIADLKASLPTTIGSLEIKQNPKEVEQHVVTDAKSILFNGEEMLRRYIAQVGTNGLDESKLLEIGRQILRGVESA